jgi:hypothetical protein
MAEFNSVERELVEDFFLFNPSLAASARIKRLEITPEPRARRATSEQRRLHFPFGLALLAKTDPPGQGTAQRKPTSAHKLVYFRVQDHVRTMGLAREALKGMLDAAPSAGKQVSTAEVSLELDLKPMHPAAREVPTEAHRARFARLFASVKNEMREKGAPSQQ